MDVLARRLEIIPPSRGPLALAAIGMGVLVVLVGAPLLGWPRVVRLPAVIVPALVLAVVVARRFYGHEPGFLGGEWQPSRRLVWSAALVIGLLLFWYVVTRFRSGEINAIDFTVYFDRPCFQTVNGRPLFVETSDTPGLSNRTELADHAYWGMLLVCSPYALYPTPLWLHAVSALSIVAGAMHVLRIVQRLGGGGMLASASALAFVLNDNTARTLNYGFHPEVLYAWFVPGLIDAALRRARKRFIVAVVACVLVKEDACLPVFAASVALALNQFRSMTWRERCFFLVLPPALALASLAAYYGYVLPFLTGHSRPSYAHFWGNYGDTPLSVAVGMAGRPGQVLKDIVTSGIFKTVQPHLFLPLLGWRWAVGTAPTIALFASSANEQVRAFGIYYSIVLVPFLVIAASVGAAALARRLVTNAAHASLAAAVIVLMGPLLVGSGHRGYSFRPWKAEIAAVPRALAALDAEPKVLVQSGLFPHAGYDTRFQLMTPETLNDPAHAGAVLLLAPGVGAYPFTGRELGTLLRMDSVRPLPDGLHAVRVSHARPLRSREPAKGHGRRAKRRFRGLP